MSVDTPGAGSDQLLVTRTYLELRSPERLRAVEMPDQSARCIRHGPCPTAHYRAMYRAVGEQWLWLDRSKWSDERLTSQLALPDVAVWELRVGETFAGYFELQRVDDGSVEVVYFGLVPAFFGKRFGGAMLTRAAREAWEMGANRVWLHTCTLDSTPALPNYKARGFDVVKVEQYMARVPRGSAA